LFLYEIFSFIKTIFPKIPPKKIENPVLEILEHKLKNALSKDYKSDEPVREIVNETNFYDPNSEINEKVQETLDSIITIITDSNTGKVDTVEWKTRRKYPDEIDHDKIKEVKNKKLNK